MASTSEAPGPARHGRRRTFMSNESWVVMSHDDLEAIRRKISDGPAHPEDAAAATVWLQQWCSTHLPAVPIAAYHRPRPDRTPHQNAWHARQGEVERLGVYCQALHMDVLAAAIVEQWSDDRLALVHWSGLNLAEAREALGAPGGRERLELLGALRGRPAKSSAPPAEPAEGSAA